MPAIKSSAELRNSYADISAFCHTYAEPVYITKNGKGDLAVMSIEAYEALAGKLALYEAIRTGLNDAEAGRARPVADVLADVKARRQR